MKNSIKSIILTGAAACLLLSGCGKDYLQTSPEDSTSPSTIFESTDNAKLAVNGLCKMMSTQYLGKQGMNGEGTMKNWFSDFCGQDHQKTAQTGWFSLYIWDDFEDATSVYNYYIWYYYYKIVANANNIIYNIDGAKGAEKEKKFIKAQALVFRAYSFFRLSEYYAYRWEGSTKDTKGIVLRTDTSCGDMPLSTLWDTYAQIYEDLNTAITLFTESGLDREKGHFYEPNLEVAHAVLARAALTRQDWETAAKEAKLARKGHPLMSKTTYMEEGFSTPDDEWIWGVFESEAQTLYFYSYFAYLASNSSASACKSYPVSINKFLYDKIPSTDCRRALWLEPTEEEKAELNDLGKSTKKLYARAFAEYGSKLNSASSIYQYMQFKFQNKAQAGVGSFSLYRAAEMIYTEAEALCHIGGHDSEVQALLNEANKNLDPSYSCTKTGAALLEEVTTYRRIDLWGEGFDWTDCKRWNIHLIRKGAKDGGNFNEGLVIDYDQDSHNKWTYVIPNKEKDYNKAI